jgi:hypothetical protein
MTYSVRFLCSSTADKTEWAITEGRIVGTVLYIDLPTERVRYFTFVHVLVYNV